LFDTAATARSPVKPLPQLTEGESKGHPHCGAFLALPFCSQSATMSKMYTINTTNLFDEWLEGLHDIRARARIVSRIKSAERGNFGDCEPVGGGISEMRIHLGAGIGCTLFNAKAWCICCCAVATNLSKSVILHAPRPLKNNLMRIKLYASELFSVFPAEHIMINEIRG
jgi:putative addiction module killer protein